MNLTGKQRSFLRKQVVTMKPIMQIGKGGLTNEIKTAIRNTLEARELIKISILQNSDVEREEVAEALEEMGFDIVQKIGRVVVVFKASTKKENQKISEEVKKIVKSR